ncbi:MAG: Ig-like domain-containing protein [Terriglobales bacterium]
MPIQDLAANASDSVGVAGVQFILDGVKVGSEITSAPYYMTWDSTARTPLAARAPPSGAKGMTP